MKSLLSQHPFFQIHSDQARLENRTETVLANMGQYWRLVNVDRRETIHTGEFIV